MKATKTVSRSFLTFLLLAFAIPAHAQVTKLYPDSSLSKPNSFNDGVVLAYPKGTLPEAGKEVDIALGDTVMVRVRNLDGWLIRRLKERKITGEPVMSPKQRDRFLQLSDLVDAKHGRTIKEFLSYYEDEALHRPKDSSGEVLKGSADWPALITRPIARTDAVPADPAKQAAELKSLLAEHDQFVKELRDSHNAFRALMEYAKQHFYLIISNSHLRGITADNGDAGNVEHKAANVAEDDTIHEFAFRLRRLEKDAQEWSRLYNGTQSTLPAHVNLGIDLGGQLFTLDSAVHPDADKPVQRVRFRLFSVAWLWSVIAGMFILFGLLIQMGSKTDLLRDPDLAVRADGHAQFSLARLQLAFWLYVVVGAFLVIWLVTDRLDTLNSSILALLGISSATMLASKLANSFTLTDGQVPPNPLRVARAGKRLGDLSAMLTKQRQDLEAEAVALESRRATLGDSDYDTAAQKLQYRIVQTDSDLDYLRHPTLMRFFIDLLSENGRLSLHRMQIVVWTVVLGIVFIARVRHELAMPVFSETLLGLMGLSSATYVALKVPELKKTEAQAKANQREGPAPEPPADPEKKDDAQDGEAAKK